ncbi:ABC transporter ATP-binding protein [Bacillus sp. FJAT-49736]|uniref:ABC transporter ATP-binding protein n=1 Tax=Bacillus sp. FJAT-49736 TaxID=2833582 RepID=UPI001BC921A5|nr:ABC transporter ATP-binding protein [Bacillus sp. FJAT-49736]MBS4174008.1 energy-coupling factor ABC transporter ATP-binding protein [Bacillus sp. FJAT-49736]
MALLEAKNITFQYPDEDQKALHNISLKVAKGEFIVLCGPSGSGKSTLLRLVKREIAPHGKMTGEILYNGQLLADISNEKLATAIGMVFQDPENQIVMDNVMEELVFGLENIGMPTAEMRKKVAEMIHFFGLEDLLERKTHELSGGQKQLLNLAAVLLMEPDILLLDEPTAQLDPVAAKEFIGMLHRMNEEFGITVIIAEHRLEELFSLADRVIVLERGGKRYDGTPRGIIYDIGRNSANKMYSYLPSSALLYLEGTSAVNEAEIPLTIKEGKRWIEKLRVAEEAGASDSNSDIHSFSKPLIQLKGIDFQYNKHHKRILNDLSLNVYEGEWLSIVGANGTGKSTLVRIIAGLQKPQRGSLFLKGKKIKGPFPFEIGYLPQNPKLFFLQDTIYKELEQIADRFMLQDPEGKIQQMLDAFDLIELKDRHPYDLSGGEVQKAALAGVMLSKPSILVIDEPTKGLDPEAKIKLGNLLKSLQNNGLTVIMVTHDIEFAAQYATRCAMMFQGNITSIASPQEFFRGNAFYTTVVNRITRDSHVPEVLTVEEARKVWHVLDRS